MNAGWMGNTSNEKIVGQVEEQEIIQPPTSLEERKQAHQ